MKITYGITVCDERDELEQLLIHMRPLINENDEIIVLRDLGKTNSDISRLLNNCKKIYNEQLIVIDSRLNGDFATFKNQLLTWATGDYLFQIDADEVPNVSLIENIKKVLEMNLDVDCYYVPRVNKVEGLTQQHINQWGWRVDEKQRINFPDPQMRILKLNKGIKWKNKVHEVLDGYEYIATLPYEDEDFCLYHHKSITKQEKQNKFYETI